jgi:hypothetical protein
MIGDVAFVSSFFVVKLQAACLSMRRFIDGQTC